MAIGRQNIWMWADTHRIDAAICDAVVTSAKENDFTPGMIGDEMIINRNIRKNGVMWLPRMHPLECIMAAYGFEANVSSGWNLDLTHVLDCAQIARYDGARREFYGVHTDIQIFNPNFAPERKMTVIVQLSDEADYTGGDVVVDRAKIEAKAKGSVIVFPSFMPHEVKPVKTGVRYSATLWIAGPRFR